jgi:hypothetical protein
LPQREEFYGFCSIDENAWGDISAGPTSQGNKTVPITQIGNMSPPPPTPTSQKTAPKPMKPGESESKQDESKVLKAASELKHKILEVGSLLLAADSYEDYLQDIINDFDQTYKSSSKAFKTVLDSPTSYSQELVSHVRDVVKAVQQINQSFESFGRGQIKFEAFKDSYATVSEKLSKQLTPTKPLTGSGMTQEQANLPKKNDRPISNIDMNSVMSFEVNKKISHEAVENDEDNIYIADHLQPEVSPIPTPSNKFKKPEEDQDEEVGFMEAEFEDAEDQDGDIQQPKGAFSMAFGNGDEDGWGRITNSNHVDASKPELSTQKLQKTKPGNDVKQKSDAKWESPQPNQSSGVSKAKDQAAPSIKVSGPASPEPKNFQPKPGKNEIEESNVFDDADERQAESPRSQLDNDREKEKPIRMTEEEKIKLALKNQKVMENPGVQSALNDFFTKSADVQPSGGLGAAFGNVFEKAKAKVKGAGIEPAEARSVSSKPFKVSKGSEENTKPSGGNNQISREGEASTQEKRSKTVPKQEDGSMTTSKRVNDDEMSQILKNARLSAARRLQGISHNEGEEPQTAPMQEKHEAKPHTIDASKTEEHEAHQEMHASNLHGGDGGLLEDGHNDYFKPFDKEKAKQEILKFEEDRKKREQMNKGKDNKTTRPNEETSGKTRAAEIKKLTQDEIKQKAEEDNFEEDFFEKAGFGAEGAMKETGVEYFDGFFDQPAVQAHSSRHLHEESNAAHDSRIHERPAPRKAERSQDHQRPPRPRELDPSKETQAYLNPRANTQGQGASNKHPNQNGSFNASDFFGSPEYARGNQSTAINPSISKVATAVQNPVSAVGASSFPYQNQRKTQDSELFFVDHGEAEGQIHITKSTLDKITGANGVSNQKLSDIVSENNRLRQENTFISKNAKTLEDTLATTTRKLRLETESQSQQSRVLQEKVREYELAYDREKKEREMFEEKYKDLYLKWRQEKEMESINSSIFDPKKILELSQVNEQLKGEKRHLATRLNEEMEKSRYVDSLKEELNKTRKELMEVTRAYNSYMVDVSKTNLNPEESILKDLNTQRRPPTSMTAQEVQPISTEFSLQGSPTAAGDLPKPEAREQPKLAEDQTAKTNAVAEGPIAPEPLGAPLISSSKDRTAPLNLPSAEDQMPNTFSKFGREEEGRAEAKHEDVFEIADRMEKEAAMLRGQAAGVGQQGAVFQNQPVKKNEEVRFSPEFTAPKPRNTSPGPVFSNGAMVYNHGIGLRSSHHSHMSQVDRLESDLLDQSDLDFLANFHRELDDTCKQIVTPRGKRDDTLYMGSQVLPRATVSTPKDFFFQADLSSTKRSTQPSFRQSLGGNVMSRPGGDVDLLQTFPQGPQFKPRNTNSLLPAETPFDKHDLMAPFTSSFGQEIPLPRRSQPQPMRDSLYSKDSVSGATVFSTVTRPAYRY